MNIVKMLNKQKDNYISIDDVIGYIEGKEE